MAGEIAGWPVELILGDDPIPDRELRTAEIDDSGNANLAGVRLEHSDCGVAAAAGHTHACARCRLQPCVVKSGPIDEPAVHADADGFAVIVHLDRADRIWGEVPSVNTGVTVPASVFHDRELRVIAADFETPEIPLVGGTPDHGHAINRILIAVDQGMNESGRGGENEKRRVGCVLADRPAHSSEEPAFRYRPGSADFRGCCRKGTITAHRVGAMRRSVPLAESRNPRHLGAEHAGICAEADLTESALMDSRVNRRVLVEGVDREQAQVREFRETRHACRR